MLTKTLSCSHCGNERLVRDGHAPNGKQKYRCSACGRRSRENPPQCFSLSTSRRDSACVSGTQQSARPHPHVWSFSHHGHCLDEKKAAHLPALSTTLAAPDPEDATFTILELDELWSFVLKKANEIWIWIALCRKTRQVVAYALGDRSKKTCLRFWQSIPPLYRKGHGFTDFWVSSQAVVPEAQHTAVGKETGETARARALE